MTAIDNQENLIRCEKCCAVTIAAYRQDEDGKKIIVLVCPACGREEIID